MDRSLTTCSSEDDFVLDDGSGLFDSDVVVHKALPPASTITTMEQTIHTMEHAQLCLHPTHYHSFQAVNFLLFPLQKCIACDVRLHTVMFTETETNKVVKCVACGNMAHRSCALSPSRQWKTTCPVNTPRVVKSMSKRDVSCVSNHHQTIVEPDDVEDDEEDVDDDGECVEVSPERNLDESMLLVDEVEKCDSFDSSPLPLVSESSSPVFKQPLPHTLHVPSISLPKSDSTIRDANDSENTTDSDTTDSPVHVTPLHYANHPFASVSKALQENITAYFQQSAASATNSSTRQRSGYPGHRSIAAQERQREREGDTTTDDNNDSAAPLPLVSQEPHGTDLLAELASSGSDTTASSSTVVAIPRNRLAELASDTLEKVKTSVFTPLGGAAVAGGVAGFVLAGPAGAYAGWQLGTTGGALGVILEGSVSIGVFVASVAGASFTAQQIQDQLNNADRRVLTMGEEGTERKVLLVRPNVRMDPVWNQIYADIRKGAPNNLAQSIPFLVDATTHDRYRRDSDIIKTAEDEIPTNDKVLLLVSRALSDKASLPGYVYRELIAVFTKRCADRNHYIQTNASILATSPRARRDDAHAVIKYVTATLLEVRPNFGATATVTELTATAVESLVFGNIYDLVMEEIKDETADMDNELSQKFAAFSADCDDWETVFVTDKALTALRMLPEAHSAVDKLRYCVEFLESLSKQFLASSTNGRNVGADSLLKMVCQHVIVARVLNLNAEVVFLEEFARDEQLLRGREGYSLVTLQAALHFLNMSQDLEADIVDQDDDEENVPIKSDPAG